MLRRIGRVLLTFLTTPRFLRKAFLGVGIVMLVWVPASFFWCPLITVPLPNADCVLASQCGTIIVQVLGDNPYRERYPTVALYMSGWGEPRVHHPSLAAKIPTATFATHSHKGLAWREWEFTFPVWIIGLTFLAWPLVTFLVPLIPIRRKRKQQRAFPVCMAPLRSELVSDASAGEAEKWAELGVYIQVPGSTGAYDARGTATEAKSPTR